MIDAGLTSSSPSRDILMIMGCQWIFRWRADQTMLLIPLLFYISYFSRTADVILPLVGFWRQQEWRHGERVHKSWRCVVCTLRHAWRTTLVWLNIHDISNHDEAKKIRLASPNRFVVKWSNYPGIRFFIIVKFHFESTHFGFIRESIRGPVLREISSQPLTESWRQKAWLCHFQKRSQRVQFCLSAMNFFFFFYKQPIMNHFFLKTNHFSYLKNQLHARKVCRETGAMSTTYSIYERNHFRITYYVIVILKLFIMWCTRLLTSPQSLFYWKSLAIVLNVKDTFKQWLSKRSYKLSKWFRKGKITIKTFHLLRNIREIPLKVALMYFKDLIPGFPFLHRIYLRERGKVGGFQ